jgi:hypothetical protein
MLDLLLALRCTYPAPVQRATAWSASRTTGDPHRALLRQLHRRRTGDPALRQHSHHFRNDVPGAANDHGIAHPHILAGQLIHVVQSRIAHGHAADEGRFEPRHGRQRAGAADLKLDVAHGRQRLLGGELMGNRPARRSRHETQLPLQR